MKLTDRQREIAELAATGMPDKAIARQLGITEGTVKQHMQGIFDRLGIRSRAMLAATWRSESRDDGDLICPDFSDHCQLETSPTIWCPCLLRGDWGNGPDREGPNTAAARPVASRDAGFTCSAANSFGVR